MSIKNFKTPKWVKGIEFAVVAGIPTLGVLVKWTNKSDKGVDFWWAVAIVLGYAAVNLLGIANRRPDEVDDIVKDKARKKKRK